MYHLFELTYVIKMTAVLGKQAYSLWISRSTNVAVHRACTRYVRLGRIATRNFCTPKVELPLVQIHATQGVGRHIKVFVAASVGTYAAVCLVGSSFLSGSETAGSSAAAGATVAATRVARAHRTTARPRRSSKERKTWLQALLDRMWALWLHGGKMLGAGKCN